ncbi:hypothetical protein HQ590_10335 [bacterium]|nr:hypothetical protein [bacterium]
MGMVLERGRELKHEGSVVPLVNGKGNRRQTRPSVVLASETSVSLAYGFDYFDQYPLLFPHHCSHCHDC